MNFLAFACGVWVKEKKMAEKSRKEMVRKRHTTLRIKLSGTAEAPRLAVYRSTQHIYAQVIDDVKGVTIASSSSNDKEMRETLKHGGNIDAAKLIGTTVAKKALKAGRSEEQRSEL